MGKEYQFNYRKLLEPVNMINLYSQGAFPMADEKGEINWYQPEIRTVIKLDNYNIPRSLKKFMAKTDFEYRYDFNIISVIENCADRNPTWISKELIKAYKRLIELGYIHSVEVYEKNKLVGGLYGIVLGGAFFGESMFSKVSQASKSALATLLNHLNEKEFVLLDVQFQTSHLKMFGSEEIDFDEYKFLLELAYSKKINFL